MRVPLATYRIQFNQNFRFADGRDLVHYLHELGISDLYSSPWFKARRGSSHGYDVADPMRVNSELGTEEEFDELSEKLRHYGMTVLLDIVPNHMAASAENPWWLDVLENGTASEYAEFFDIDWHPATSKAAFLQDNRVLLAILGDLYGNVLENQELSLRIDDDGFFVRYYDHRLPLDPKTYDTVLMGALEQNPGLDELRALLEDLSRLPSRDESDYERLMLRRSQKKTLKHRLWTQYRDEPAVKQAIDDALRQLNGVRDDPSSFDALDRLLSRQAFRVAHWKIGFEEINYRRFFDINELIGLRVEVPGVFELRHLRILELIRAEKVSGLRIDHVDGLYDPRGYLARLQQAIGQPGGFYVLVEKILGADERLPKEWAISGTTGYDFLNALNGIFIHRPGLEALTSFYRRRTGIERPFEEICYAANKKVMRDLFIGEVNALGHDLGRLAAHDRQARDVPLSELKDALIEVTACLPVYRTYVREFDISEADRGYIERTIRVARERTAVDSVGAEAFDFLRRVLLLEPRHYTEDQKPQWLAWVLRWQQFTGPVMAKGLEDTASYRYNSLISVNDVGSDPLRLEPPTDLAGFHAFNTARLREWRHAMNATSTHDTKRGEDARARINVLSEIPWEWEERFECWSRLNEGFKRRVAGDMVPGPNEEFLIYQMLLGTWPIDESEVAGYPERFRQFLIKAAREAKTETSWIRMNTEYEDALTAFATDVLAEDSRFMLDFLPFQRKVAFYGAINGLSQALLKITVPGVPDFYQGSELWNLSMVDPDNRRPVNYARRMELMDSLNDREAAGLAGLAAELAHDLLQDTAKLFVVRKALGFRRTHQDLFAEGDYQPLAATGARAENVIAFARRRESEWTVVVTPRWTTQLCEPGHWESCNWGDTALAPPEGAPSGWRNVFTGAPLATLRLDEILGGFPVALLEVP
ncbi:MAG TPA: malto-oligosyltrehalose synthase [Bryobacteraceae bacterium]|nr:malto-oligosyltrehalose synthase [Bryobacteraceae bacterium]